MLPLQNIQFNLDTSGVAGFFGGEESVSAMATVHIYEGRTWLGWYNSPGSYTVAKKYGRLARSRFWDSLYPGVSVDPSTLFEYDGNRGPEFIAAHSGARLKDTGHVGHLFLTECKYLDAEEVNGRSGSKQIPVTIAHLGGAPPAQIHPKSRRRWATLFAVLPILTSVGCCITAAIFRDWYCFSMIMLGILSGGLSCAVIGSGKLIFDHPNPAEGSPKGDGILHAGTEIVVLCGSEGAVNSVTRGSFSLKFSSEPECRNIGLVATLLTAQFLLQLLLIPQATRFGQILFVSTLAVSWAYNCYLSSFDKERIQREILMDEVLDMKNQRSSLKRYLLPTWTAMTVFVLLLVRPSEPEKMLNNLLPNDTKVWRRWKQSILEKLEAGQNMEFEEFSETGFSKAENSLLNALYEDAADAYKHYRNTRYFIQPKEAIDMGGQTKA
jgi:hypothetical protein